jgi:hypothetical protein
MSAMYNNVDNVTGFLTRQLDIYHTIPLPMTLECEPAYASQITTYASGMRTAYNNPRM